MMLHYHPPGHFAARRDHWREVNEVRAAQDSLAHDGLLMEAALNALAEDEPSLKAKALGDLAEVAMAFAEAVEEQSAEEEPKPKGGK